MSFEILNKPDDGWKIPGNKEHFTLEKVFEKINEFMRLPEYTYDVGVGTDSQMVGKVFQFISVISVHRVGKGGLYYYHKSFVPRVKFPVENQKMRMFYEVARSIELATEMQSQISVEPVVHIDASPPSKKGEFTAKFSEQLRGYVTSCGFDCTLKPESYVAHAIADRHTKKRSRKRRARKFAK